MRFLYQLLFLGVFIFGSASAQDRMATRKLLADALVLLPAKDAETAKIALEDLMSLDDEGFSRIFEGVRPSGEAVGVPYRYAVALLATAKDNTRLELALLRALEKVTNAEVKQYFLQYVARVGTDRSVPMLGTLFNDPALADPAISALEAIGSQAALDVLGKDLDDKPNSTTIRRIKALGHRRAKASVPVLLALAKSEDVAIKRESLWALATIGDPTAEITLIEQATLVGFKEGPAQQVEALIQYIQMRQSDRQYPETAVKALLQNTLSQDQQHYRLPALRASLQQTDTKLKFSFLSKELNRFDETYRRNVLNLAVPTAQEEFPRKGWISLYNRSKGEQKAEILAMLAQAKLDSVFIAQVILPALDSEYPEVRKVAFQSLGTTRKAIYADRLASILINSARSNEDLDEARKAFLQVAQPDNVRSLAKLIPKVNPAVAVSIVNIVAERRDVDDGALILGLTSSPNPALRAAAFPALPRVTSPALLETLLAMLRGLTSRSEIAAVQQSLISLAGPETTPRILKAAFEEKIGLLPVLPYLGNEQSLTMVKSSFQNGQQEEREVAFTALTNWQNGDGALTLLSILREPGNSYHARAFPAYVKQVAAADWPSDQKLLRLREAFPLAASLDERKMVVREIGGVRTFLSFAFVSSLLDDPDLGGSASRSAMRLAQPTADGQPGMTGVEVRKALEKVMEKLTGPDSQYDRIDVQTYLEQMPFTLGYEPIFNGKDLSGWQGLVENPIARAKMTKEQMASKQAAANTKMSGSWSVKDGILCFTGNGENLCTTRSFGNFELLVDYKIPRNGDSGIYLRGSPQVQIWDPARSDAGADLGSGGLYNNTVNRDPLKLADNPIGDWNTLRITMIGERVTVYLNGIQVVDNVVMENYWERKIPIFSEGPIELQSHGTELMFRNLYVRELNRPYQLSAEEKGQGFELLFNSKDLSGWVGNKTDYVVDDQVIAIYPTVRGRGNLYTEKEYTDFVFRFEFQLTPGGNNGLGIHAPLEGDAAYVGKEIQILDDRHVAYSDIEPWQVHGSVYGIIAAKRDALRPTGQWNVEEVEVRGDRIKVTVNGIVIVDGDMKKASAKGTLDGREHPGLQRHTGHIGFLGHGSVVRFRNIRIRDLTGK